jgi:uncharacterized membrane protein YkoI
MSAGPRILVLLALLSALTVAGAQSRLIEKRERDEYQIDAGGISLDQAVSMAERRYRAKAVKVNTIREGERLVYQIRLLSADGTVLTVHVDAQSGTMN